MINLTVSEAHTYYVGRQEALVHNGNGCFKLQRVGNNAYRSPEGLIYGNDHNWPNRIEHVMKHTGDDLTRAKHDVFDGHALEITDRAYAMIKANPTQYIQSTQGNRTIYVVPMGKNN